MFLKNKRLRAPVGVMPRQQAVRAAVARLLKLALRRVSAHPAGSRRLVDPLLGVGQRRRQAVLVRPVRRQLLALAVPCRADPEAQALKLNSQPGSVVHFFPRWPEPVSARRSIAIAMASALIGIRLMAGPRV